MTTNMTTIALAMPVILASCVAISDTHTNATTVSASLANTQPIVADFRTIDSQVLTIEPDVNTNRNEPSDNAGPNKVDAKKIVDAALGAGAFERYRLADSAQGYFTSSEQQQSLYVIANRKVTAVAKEITPSILVIFQEDKPITQFVPSKASYLDIAAVFDVNNDGLTEVLLTATAYQMGSLFVAADVYSFANPNDILKQEIGVVYVNACDTVNAHSQQVRASVLYATQDTDELLAKSYIAPCDNNGDSPNAELFIIDPIQ